MDKTPKDIMEAAERVYDKLGRGPHLDTDAIADAIMAERERCRRELTELSLKALDLADALKDVLPYAEASIGLPRQSWPTDSAILKAYAALAKAEGAA